MSMARHSCFLVIKNGISESKTHKIVEKSAEEVARMTLQRGKIFCFFDAVVLVLHPPAERACIIIRLKQSVKKSITACRNCVYSVLERRLGREVKKCKIYLLFRKKGSNLAKCYWKDIF